MSLPSLIHFDSLDRTGGNGARSVREDWLDENTTSAENEWTSARTTFRYWEAPDHKQRQFKSLYDQQHGKGDPERSSELPRMRAIADAKAFCSVLEFADSVVERVIYILERIDISSSNSGGKSYEKIVLAVCSLAYDEYLSSMPRNSIEYEQRLIFDETFRDLMENNKLGSQELRGIREQIRSETDFF